MPGITAGARSYGDLVVFRRSTPILAVALLAAGTLTAGAAVTSAAATPAANRNSKVSVSRACDRTPAAGHFTCFALRRTDVGFTPKSTYEASPAATPRGYGPSDLQSAYALPTSRGAGRRVYVVDAFDDPTAEQDLAVYRRQYGLPACTTGNKCFQKLNQRGGTTPPSKRDEGWAGETSLDLDMVSAVCPQCDMTLIQSDDDSANLLIAVKKATDLGARFVSMSWGGQESAAATTFDSRYFAATGVVFAAATGDNGFADGVEYPATSPRSVAVGGTRLAPNSGTSRGWSETVWNSDRGATGSGCSGEEAKPSWQQVVPASTCTMRAESDVSAVADPALGVAVYQTFGGGGWGQYGGTSAATPVIASVYALAGTPSRAGSPGSFPYAHTGSLNDVTNGDNGTCQRPLLCTADTGWDGPTGVGTPAGIGAFSAAGSTSNQVTLASPGNQVGTVGRAATLQVSASDSEGARLVYSARNLPVGLTIDASTGQISGTFNRPGDYSTRVVAFDSTGASDSALLRWNVTAARGSCSGNLLTNSGFESGTAGWSTSGSIIYSNRDRSHGGSRFTRLDGFGRTHRDRLSRVVTIPAGCKVRLGYYLWVNSSDRSRSAHDTLVVSAGGDTVRGYSNRNRGGRYYRQTFDLSKYAGSRITLSWLGSENASVPTSFYLDDIGLGLS